MFKSGSFLRNKKQNLFYILIPISFDKNIFCLWFPLSLNHSKNLIFEAQTVLLSEYSEHDVSIKFVHIFYSISGTDSSFSSSVMLLMQIFLPRFLVLEVVLFFHFIQQGHGLESPEEDQEVSHYFKSSVNAHLLVGVDAP